MDVLSKNIMRALIDKRQETCISIYMPTRSSGSEAQQNLIRFKNLLRRADHLLDAGSPRHGAAHGLLEPAWKLVADHAFWLHQSSGFAMFVSRDTFLYWRFPISFEEVAVVGDRFYLKPLLPLLNQGGQFYILGLSHGRIRLFHETRSTLSEIDVSNINDAAAEMLRNGGAEKENLLRFLRMVDRRVGEIIRDRNMPLILTCVDELLPHYMSVSTHPNLLHEHIAGSPESIADDELHERALAIMQAQLKKEQSEVVEQCLRADAAGHASTDICRIVEAASQGRIELLIVADGTQQWGTIDPVTNEVHIHKKPQPVDEDLLDFAAMHALVTGATVYTVDPDKLPDHKPAAALLRY